MCYLLIWFCPFFLGLLGLINTIVMSPILLFLWVIGAETASIPSSQIFLFLLINAVTGIFSDYLWARSILMTTPLIATIGQFGKFVLLWHKRGGACVYGDRDDWGFDLSPFPSLCPYYHVFSG